MSLNQLWVVLVARWRAVFGVTLGSVVLALAFSLVFPKRYTASAELVVDVKSTDPVAGVASPAELNPSYMPTQVDIVSSRRVAERVVSLLKLKDSLELQQAWRDATDGRGSLEQWLIVRLQKKLEVKPSRDSNVIDINFTANDPEFAAAVANAFARAFVEVSLELRVDPARQYASWFDDRTRQLRDDLERAQRKLSAEQRDKGVFDGDQRIDYETARLGELSSQLTQMQALQAETLARQRQAGNGNEAVSEVLQSPSIAALKDELTRAEAREQQLRARLGASHPSLENAVAEVALYRDRLTRETERIASSLKGTHRVSMEREAELRAALEAQRAKVFQLNQDRDSINVLKRDAEAAQRAYDLVTQRLAQTRLESQTQQTNIAVLTYASAPLEASFPKPILNTLLGLAVGLVAGVGTALTREVFQRHVRSEQDLAEMLGIPVLAVVGHEAS